MHDPITDAGVAPVEVNPRLRRLIPGRFTLVLAAVVGLAALGGVAYAASGSSFVGPHGNINTCVPPNGGTVNVWKPGHKCSGGRVGLAFPASAPKGAQGAPGASGASGATGPTGATGPSNPSATTVDGETVTKLLLREPTPASGTTTATLYSGTSSGTGLTIVAQCDSSGNASLVANGPSSADSELTVSGYDNAGTPDYGSQTDNLGPTSQALLGPPSAGEASFSYASSSGQVVTGNVGYQKSMSFGSYLGCAFFGTVVSG
jgi:hypothetical protein